MEKQLNSSVNKLSDTYKMLVVQVDEVNERWEYTLDFIFGLRGIEFQLTDSTTEFDAITSPKISFSKWNSGQVLNESGLTQMKIGKSIWKGIECLAFDGEPDPISSIFYVLTRMEEYQPVVLDQHGRFMGNESVQFKNGWLQQCICDRWALAIIAEIEREIQQPLDSKIQIGQLIPSFDIDNTYAYLLKRGKRKLLSMARDVLQGNFKRLHERHRVLARKKKDPYDTFEWIGSVAQKFKVRIFWLVGDYGNLDNNISRHQIAHQNLIRKMSEKAEFGIHPSYVSNEKSHLLSEEKASLEETLQRKVQISRQHFLKLKFPTTFQHLINEGIQEDFTMGFADEIGFRNGTAHKFPWFDLSVNKKTDLQIRPFAYMDGTLLEYKKYSIAESKSKIQDLFQEVQQYGGDFIFLWHNETIGDYGKWKGWKNVLEYTLTLKNDSNL